MNTIQLYLINGNTVLVRKIDTNQTMTAVAFAMVDTGTILEQDPDIISCKWRDSNGYEHRNTFNINELELA
jgi:hypothetical protein